MLLTAEQIAANDHIPSEEILRDIHDTKAEIEDYQAELKLLSKRSSPQDKTRRYLLEGRIAGHRQFVANLEQILHHRAQVK